MDEHSELLEKHFSLKEINAGEYWAVEGQYTKSIGYVESGLLHAYQIDNQDEIVTTNFFTSGSFCGSFYSFYNQQPSLEYIKAITPIKIHTIGFDTLHELFEEDLTINKWGRKAIEKVCIDKDIRLSKMLKLDAKERYLWFLESYPMVVEKAPLKLIASYLGMKPESLSRIRKEIVS